MRTRLAKSATVEPTTAAHREASPCACSAGALPVFSRDERPGSAERGQEKARVAATTITVASVRVPLTLLIML